MEKLKLYNFFDLAYFDFQGILTKESSCLDILAQLEFFITNFFKELRLKSTPKPIGFSVSTGGLYCNSNVLLKEPYINNRLKIYIDKGCSLEPGVLIKCNTIVFKNSELRQACYLRKNCVIGPFCVVGHCTEVKSSILLKQVEAGHFNYVGNSIVGSYVNLGAGAKLANLEFRDLKSKQQATIRKNKLKLSGTQTLLGPAKIGSILGDSCEIGCNAVLAPGCFLGQNSIVWPNFFLKKGLYPANFLAR